MTENGHESDELSISERQLAERLSGFRPVPRAAFRGALARSLAQLDPGYGPRPSGLGKYITALVLAAALLMLLGVLQAIGSL